MDDGGGDDEIGALLALADRDTARMAEERRARARREREKDRAHAGVIANLRAIADRADTILMAFVASARFSEVTRALGECVIALPPILVDGRAARFARVHEWHVRERLVVEIGELDRQIVRWARGRALSGPATLARFVRLSALASGELVDRVHDVRDRLAVRQSAVLVAEPLLDGRLDALVAESLRARIAERGLAVAR